MTTTATLSKLLRQPNEVIDQLEDGDVVLTRREGDSLRLSKESSASRDHEMVGALAQLIANVVVDETAADRVAMSMVGPFPWIDFLSESGRREFVAEFLRTARASASIQRFDRLAIVVANWRETATAYSLGLDQTLRDVEYLDDAIDVPDPGGE